MEYYHFDQKKSIIDKWDAPISTTVVVLSQSGNLLRKPSGGERAWFLEEESEPRNKVIFLAGENRRADAADCQIVSSPRL
jgi:hypothetical protein